MSAELINGQYELGSVVFGSNTLYPVELCEPSGYGVTVGDYSAPETDEIRFGRDTLQPGTLQFTMGVMDNRPNFGSVLPLEEMQYEGARKYLEKLAAEWKSDDIRSTWGAVKPLRYNRDGFTRRAYGRPRKFTHGAITRKSEFVPVACEFQLADTNFYDDTENLITLDAGNSATLTRGEGRGKAWFQVFIEGPIINPTLTFSGLFTMQLTYTVQAGRIAQISTYPWERRAVSSLGENLAPLLGGTTPYMERLYVPSGAETMISFNGSGTDANTKAHVLWREVYHTF